MMNKKLISTLVSMVFVMAIFSPKSFAQDEENSDISTASDVDQIEAEIGKQSVKKPEPVLDNTADEKIQDLSGLSRLAPFSEVSVIQRRYLPKTGRFQVFTGLTNIVNDPWYMGIGLDLRAAYHLTEAWGVELQGSFISNSERQAIKDLDSENNVKTSSVISFQGYTGAAVTWNPIYGKMGFFNKRIIPFDMYFSVGAGNTKVDNGSGGSTFHFGTGQIYALSKGMAFRWDFSWNAVSAKPTGASDQNFNNLLLSLGVSFFFPEAGYR